MSHSCKGVCKSSRFIDWLDHQYETKGQDKVKKCSECRIRFKQFDGWYCPCCGNGIRTRNTYYKENMKEKKNKHLIEVRTQTVTVNGIEILKVVRV